MGKNGEKGRTVEIGAALGEFLIKKRKKGKKRLQTKKKMV